MKNKFHLIQREIKTTLIVTFLMFSFYVNLCSQEIMINGRVLNSNNEILQYVNIYVKESNIGTISNANGEFNLKIPIKYAKDTLYFSYIGFKTHKEIIKLNYDFLIVKLELYSECVNAVNIKQKMTTSEDLLALAFTKTKENILQEPNLVNIFSRNIVKINKEYVYYRKTISELELMQDNLWFTNGRIINTELYNNRKNINNEFEKQTYVEDLFYPSFEYIRSFNKHFIKKVFNKCIIKKDTAIFFQEHPILIIDVYNEEIEDLFLIKIKSILKNTVSPYNLIYDKNVEEIGLGILNNELLFIRFYIDIEQNYNIIKLQYFSFSSSTFLKKSFEYTVAEFSNIKNKSTPTYILTYKDVVNSDEKNPSRVKSLFETFTNNRNDNIMPKENFSDSTLFNKYNNTSFFMNYFSNYNDTCTVYIKPDSLDIEAITFLKKAIIKSD